MMITIAGRVLISISPKGGLFYECDYTILYYTILYYTIPYHTIPYHTILYYTILYHTVILEIIVAREAIQSPRGAPSSPCCPRGAPSSPCCPRGAPSSPCCRRGAPPPTAENCCGRIVPLYIYIYKVCIYSIT